MKYLVPDIRQSNVPKVVVIPGSELLWPYYTLYNTPTHKDNVYLYTHTTHMDKMYIHIQTHTHTCKVPKHRDEPHNTYPKIHIRMYTHSQTHVHNTNTNGNLNIPLL